MSPELLQIKPKSPPSHYAIADVLDGKKGSLFRVFGGTLQRSLFIAPGLALADVRGKQLVKGALLSSLSITTGLFILYALRKADILSFEDE